MRFLRPTLVIVAAGVTLSACSDDHAPSVTAPPPVRLSASLSLVCDPASLTTLASAYAASPNDALFGIIAALVPSAFHPGPVATDLAFDGLSRLAAMRGTSAQKSGASGATFDALVKGFLGCTESYISSTVPATFSVANALGSGWMFEVRGDDSQDPASAGAYARGSTPFWAAEPQSGKTWGNSLEVTAPSTTTATNRVLIYGFRQTDYTTLDPKVGNAFELQTVPTIASGVLSLTPAINIGLCQVDLTETARVQHVVSILPGEDLTCAAPPSFSAGASLAKSLVSRAVGFFAPRTLEAAMFVGSIGGAVSELSPSAVIDMQEVDLDFILTLKDGNKNEPLQAANGGPVKVDVGTKNGSPLTAATVTLSIEGNRSSHAYFQDGNNPPSATVTRTTDQNGIATFAGVKVSKPGGFRIVATGNFDGVDGVPVTSNLFNIKNK
jgi:hypothetical protein